MLVSLVIAFVIENLIGWAVVAAYIRRRHPELAPKINFKWGSLIIVALAVVVSRLTGFEPGIVFGLILGLSFGVGLAVSREARIMLAGTGFAFGLAIVGWLGYSVLTAWLGEDPGVVGVFAIETFAGFAVGGIAALPIALLPLGFMEGAKLFTFSKVVWAAAYTIGLFAFLVVLMPMPFSWDVVSVPFVTWITIYLAYAVFAVALWATFAIIAKRAKKPEVVPA